MQLVNKDNLNQYLRQLENRYEDVLDFEKEVKMIIEDVRSNGDDALRFYTNKWDNVNIEVLRVSEEEINEAYERLDSKLLYSLNTAKENIETYHKIQVRSSRYIDDDQMRIGEIIRPLDAVGIYVPGGKAAYPSTVLMNAVPAKLAGVARVVMVTPPQKNGLIKDSVLAAAKISGITEIYKVGGAQSIAALTFGTSSIKPVKKIVGPGNIYVATAKKIVSDRVGIDMIAGPSEVLILADASSNPNFIAADMIAQAEHDERAAAITITTDESLVPQILKAIEQQIQSAPRNDIIQKSLNNFGAVISVETIEDMLALANEIAPEHLEIMTQDPDSFVEDITAAGAIFVGDYSPEALGDYFAGPNHTLPTSGTAKFASPLSVDDFIKKTSYIKYDRNSLKIAKDSIIRIADDEGLFGHANSIRVRFEEV